MVNQVAKEGHSSRKQPVHRCQYVRMLCVARGHHGTGLYTHARWSRGTRRRGPVLRGGARRSKPRGCPSPKGWGCRSRRPARAARSCARCLRPMMPSAMCSASEKTAAVTISCTRTCVVCFFDATILQSAAKVCKARQSDAAPLKRLSLSFFSVTRTTVVRKVPS